MKGGLGAQFYLACQRASRAYRTLFSAQARGFTVIEVLVVLAVTGALFVGAAVLISGKQNQTAFSQAIREIQSQIQQTINEVAIGYYANLGNFSCVGAPSGPSITATSGGQQGTNSDCIFMGKVIQFKVAGTDPEQFKIYTVAGLRLSTATGDDVDTRVAAKPVAIAPSTSRPSVPDNSTTEILQNGLSVHSMEWGPGSASIGAVGFSQSLAQYSGSVIQSGSQKVDVIPINASSLNMTAEAAAESINATFAAGAANPAEGVRICFVSGGTNQSGLITIGSNNRELSVKLDIKSNKTCS